MAAENFFFRIRSAEKGFFKTIKNMVVFILRFNFPAPKIIFRPLYELLIIFRYLIPLMMQKLFYVPIFKARCKNCGKYLSILNGIPWIEGNLIINIGNEVTLDKTVFVSGKTYEDPKITIGDGTFIGYETEISVSKSVTIGKNCMIARNCFIADNNGHHINPQKRLSKEPLPASEIKPVTIKDNVWIGTGAVVLRGVKIGKGSIVSANSLVTKSVPPNSIAMGVPARVILSGLNKLNI
jgi:acetyltransferase-like isoleucine patch superfamily enzyme